MAAGHHQGDDHAAGAADEIADAHEERRQKSDQHRCPHEVHAKSPHTNPDFASDCDRSRDLYMMGWRRADFNVATGPRMTEPVRRTEPGTGEPGSRTLSCDTTAGSAARRQARAGRSRAAPQGRGRRRRAAARNRRPRRQGPGAVRRLGNQGSCDRLLSCAISLPILHHETARACAVSGRIASRFRAAS